MERAAPENLQQTEELVAAALAEKRPLEILGAGSKRAFGRPVEAQFALTTERLAGVTLYEPGELVMTAGAGTPLAEIEAMLAEHHQELAFEPADYGRITGGEPGRQTIGGVFACNLSGPRRIKAGAARDHLLGLRCVTGFGREIKTGGRVMKNVTGYDLCKLLTGSFGTLAVITELTFKVLPAAETAGTLLLSGAAEADLLAALRAAMGTPYDVSAAALLPAPMAARSAVDAVRAAGRALAAIRVEGPAPSVDYCLERLTAALTAPGRASARLDAEASRLLWREIRDLALLPETPCLWRLSVPPSAAETVASRLSGLAAARLHDWSGGLVWLAMEETSAEEARAIRESFAAFGGHATLVRAPEAVRAAVEVFQPQPPALAALTRRVKASFDPERILNRGRMYREC